MWPCSKRHGRAARDPHALVCGPRDSSRPDGSRPSRKRSRPRCLSRLSRQVWLVTATPVSRTRAPLGVQHAGQRSGQTAGNGDLARRGESLVKRMRQAVPFKPGKNPVKVGRTAARGESNPWVIPIAGESRGIGWVAFSPGVAPRAAAGQTVAAVAQPLARRKPRAAPSRIGGVHARER